MTDAELAEYRRRLPPGSKVQHWPGYNQHTGHDTATSGPVERDPRYGLVVPLEGRTAPVSVHSVTRWYPSLVRVRAGLLRDCPTLSDNATQQRSAGA